MQTRTLVGSRYRLERPLANGGMGDVWVAEDELLGRRVATKLLRSELAEDEGFRQRFRAEAQAAARLTHPGVVAVYDYGEDDGVPFLAMELVNGEPLSSLLQRRGRLSTAESMSIVTQAASALDAAHREGLVHRDVKPANLLLRPDGRLKVTDFGIVRAVDGATVTDVGTVMGTVAYMSPEQVRGQRVTAASDLYSLGVVAYECLSGVRPFDAEESIAVALAHVRDPLPALPSEIAPDVRRLVSAMLEKEPAHRPSSASAVANAARRLTAGRGIDSVRHDPRETEELGTFGLERDPAGTAPADRITTAPVAAAGGTVVAPPPPARRDPVQPLAWRRELLGALAALRGGRRRGASIAGVFALALFVILATVVLDGGSGATAVRVPSVARQPVGVARARLHGLGLRTIVITSDIAGMASGVVASQSPAPDRTVGRGSPVRLTVASGYVVLPAGSLDGRPAATGAAKLHALGLAGEEKSASSATVAAGDVVSFSPSGRLREGRTITVVVSTGPPSSAPAATTGGPAPPQGPPGHGGGGPGGGGPGPGHGGPGDGGGGPGDGGGDGGNS